MTSHSDRPQPGCKIDWYSFTIPSPTPFLPGESDHHDRVSRLVNSVFGPLLKPLDYSDHWSTAPAKGFYSFRSTHQPSRIAVSWGEVNAHVFVECSGQACDWLRAAGQFNALVMSTHLRVSRIDAAIDICTTTTPADFLACGYAARFSESTGDVRTKTGDTCYVGSRKSERCARVYRYQPPHPRSQFLRVETEFKGKAAKALAAILNAEGEIGAIRSAHNIFKWASGEVMMDFLQLRNCYPDHQTGPVTGSTDGSNSASYPLLFDISAMNWLTLESGLKQYYNRRWRRPRWPVANLDNW